MSRLLTLGSMLLCLLSAAPSGAQGPAAASGVISGAVRGRAGAPVPSASVTVRRSTDTLLVAGDLTDSTGAFRVTGVAPGSYRVEIRRIGFGMVTRRGVTITSSASSVDIGVVRMEPSVVGLEGVTVSAARSPVTVLPDRNVYATRNMPVAAGGTATDVLRNVPELEVSVEGAVTTRGATPQIHIDGRPAPMQGEALERYLQQLPADRIERVEVIANPSARYAAEGQGGIVNIVMKRGTSLGVSGSVTANLGTLHQRGGSGNVTLRRGRLSVIGGASASFSGSASENSDLRENLNVQPATFIQQDASSRASGGQVDANVAAEWQAGSHGTFWADVAAGRSPSEATALTTYSHLDHLQNLTERYDRANETDARGGFSSVSAGYRNVADGGRREWSVEVRRNANGSDRTEASARRALGADGAALELPPELTFADQGQHVHALSAEANLRRGWGETGHIEVGYRGSSRSGTDDYRRTVDESDAPGVDREALGDFRQRERIHAAFVSVGRRLGRIDVQAGLRGEQAAMRRGLPLTSETFDARYANLFPSFQASTQLGAATQLSLGYSQRVSRPWGTLLNPAVPVVDPLNLRVGNPYLAPRYTHALSLTVTRAGRLGTLQLSPFYRRSVDGWDQVRTVDATGVSTVTWQNVATISSYGGNLSASLLPVGRVSGLLNLGGYREVRDGGELAPSFSGTAFRYSALGNMSVRATDATSVQSTVTYLPARNVPQGRISSMVFSTVGVRQQLWGGRGSVNLSIVDPFELQRLNFTTRDGTHVQLGSSAFSSRRVSVGVTYGFGRQSPRRGRRGADDDQQNDAQVIR